ncbi:hypothetical protein PUN28_001060 [Cardiocondyla obscurior]|uniref:Uncharacterized protein n=1 Tax=Cardiocondyla obscurior TaxID=286306 RepID=A0AAW2H369_9HYME
MVVGSEHKRQFRIEHRPAFFFMGAVNENVRKIDEFHHLFARVSFQRRIQREARLCGIPRVVSIFNSKKMRRKKKRPDFLVD